MMEGSGRRKVLFERVLCLYRLGREEECLREVGNEVEGNEVEGNEEGNEVGNGETEAECLRVAAEVWFRRGQKEKAEGCLKKALKIYTETQKY
jgi:hypothetical protein